MAAGPSAAGPSAAGPSAAGPAAAGPAAAGPAAGVKTPGGGLPAPAPLPESRSSLDVATAAGLTGGIGLIATAIVLGGSAGSFFNLPSLLIVFGGTIAAVTIGFSAADVIAAARDAARALVRGRAEPAAAATRSLRYAEIARRQGHLPLQRHLDDVAGEPALHKGLSLVVDGLGEADLESILLQDLHARAHRTGTSAAVLRKAAEFAPAMGLIGTLIGLVQMLSRLEDPSTIGPAMAVALLTTFYGAVLANLVLAPVAAKIERIAARQALIDRIYIVATISIARQENPRQLEILLNSVLPPGERISYFD